MVNLSDQRPSGPPGVAWADQPPLAYPAALRALACCGVRVVALLCRRRVHLPARWVRTRLRFADGTSAPVYRETLIDYGAAPARCVLVVTFTLRWVRGWGHAVFRAESLLNTVLFAGFPGLVSKLWLANDSLGRYRGVYEWDGPQRADQYARALWRVLALVSVPGSIHYVVLPGLTRDDFLREPQATRGLAPALQAHGHGARVRVIDRRPDPFRPSRALILHPRTLEVLRPLGVTQALLAKADVKPAADLHAGNRVVQVRLSGLALPDTAFPHVSLIRQMDAETVLAQALADRGVEVEYGTELVSALDTPDAARAALRAGGRTSEADFAFIAGCDGPASTVRSLAGIGWPGAPYPVEILLADVELAGDLAGDRTHVVAGREGIAFAFRLGEQATWRLLFTRPASPGTSRLPFGQPGPPVPADELRALLRGAGLTATVTDVAWSARIRIQRRVADQFRRGRLFIAGDAAHAYSPATGQGMNAAIQDAANLGWKLAFAAASPPGNALLLDSYESERRPVAREVLGLTHLAFWAEAGTGRVPALLRARGVPLAVPLIPALMRRRRLVALAIRVISQLAVGYRGSPLSVSYGQGTGGGPQAGDRLPDTTVTAAGQRVRLHELLSRPGVHVLLERDAELARPPASPFVHVHRLTSAPGRGLLTVRPDGYVGLRCQAADAGKLDAWLTLAGGPGRPRAGRAGRGESGAAGGCW